MPLLSVEKLSIDFLMRGSWLPAVSDVSFSLAKGEVLALVGESGCGKSVTCLSLAKLLPEPPARYASGSILLEDKGKTSDVLKLHPRELRKIRGGRIAYIFQEPSVSLNPVFRIGEQIAEAIELHRPELEDIRGEVVALLRQVGISEPERRVDAYPHEMSGGMQQRVMIAMALACKPEILVADEPTTALDVTIQAQMIDLIADLREKTGTAVVLITHDLGVVVEAAETVAVMYAGQIVEYGSVSDLFPTPLHPYTLGLMNSIPRMSEPAAREGFLEAIPGVVPPLYHLPTGCRFRDRCPEAFPLCERAPMLEEVAPDHLCRCWLYGEKG